MDNQIDDDLQRHHDKLMDLLDDPQQMMQSLGTYARATHGHLMKARNSTEPLPKWYRTVKNHMDEMGLSAIIKQANNAQGTRLR